MVRQIIWGVLGILIGGGGLIAFIVSIAKSPPVSEEEKALRKQEFEKAKRQTNGCSQLIALLLGIILLLIAILR